MKKKKLNNIFYILEEEIGKLINIFIKNNSEKLNLNLNNITLRRACEKHLYTLLHNSNQFLKFFSDIKNNNLKKKYVFESYEIMLIAKDLANLYNKKIKLEYKKNYIKKISFFIRYFILIIYVTLFKFKTENNQCIVFQINDKKFEYKSKYLLQEVNAKKIFLDYKKSLWAIILSKKKFSLGFDYKEIFYQRNFFFIHKLYSITLIYEIALHINNPYLILFFEGDSSNHEIISAIGKKKKIKTICIQWGAFLSKNYKNTLKNSGFDTFLAWSKYYKKEILKHNKIPEVIVKGNCFISKKTGLKNKVLFLLPQTTFETSINQAETFDKVIDWFSKKYPGEGILRSHPYKNEINAKKSKFNLSNLIIHDADKISIDESLNSSYMIVTCGSSVIFEAGKLGIIPLVILDNDKTPWTKNIEDLKKKYPIRLIQYSFNDQVIENIELIRNNKKIRMLISNKVLNNFSKECSSIGERALNEYTEYFNSIIKSITSEQNFKYLKFFEKLITNERNSFFHYKQKKYNLKSYIQKFNYVRYSENPNFFNLCKNFNYKKNYIKKFELSCFFLLYRTEFFLNLRLFFNQDLIKPTLNNNYIFCVVAQKKHVDLIKKFQVKINYRCIYIIQKRSDRKILGLNKFNSIVLPNLSFINTSFIPNKKSIAKFHFKVSHNLFIKYKPKFILTVEGDSPLADSICNVAKKFNIKSICLQWGIFPRKYPKVTFKNMPYNYYLSSGPLFSRILKSHNKKTKFLEFSDLIENKKRKKINKILFILQPEHIYSTKTDLITLSKIAVNLSKKFTNWDFVVRDHPSYQIEKLNLKKKNNIIIERYDHKDINESLAEAKILVSISSSAIIEGLYYNVVPCIISPGNNFQFYPNFKKKKNRFCQL